MILLTAHPFFSRWQVCALFFCLVLAVAVVCPWGQTAEARLQNSPHTGGETQFTARMPGNPGTSSVLLAEGQMGAPEGSRGHVAPSGNGSANSAMAYGAADQVPWRIRFVEAAVIEGDMVTLGEVAVPAGAIPRQEWEKLAKRSLWPSPPDNGRAVNMTRPKLQEAVMATMRDLAPYCLFPSSLALQRGGAVMHEPAIQSLAVKELTPLVAGIEAETMFKDFRLPAYIFLEHPGQIVGIEPQKKIAPGRVNFRIIVKEVDGSVAQRIAGSAFLDAWKEVPSATVALNRNDILEASQVGRIRVNLAHLRGTPWDGRGGPWRMVRAVGVEQVIYQNDIAHIPTVSKGTVLNLLYESNTVRLQVQAEALTDGVVGENIRVKNLQSKKEVYGVVRDASTVVIRGNFQ